MTMIHRFCAFAGIMLWSAVGLAHKPSDGFLTIDIEGTTVSGQLDLAIKDLEMLLGLDKDADYQITWGELSAQKDAILSYAIDRLKINANGQLCELDLLDLQVSDYTDGAYASLIFNTSCVGQPVLSLDVEYHLLFDLDAQHRGLMTQSFRDELFAHIFSEESRTYHFDAMSGGNIGRLKMFVREGMKHIFNGYDHMLFLIALVLPAVFFGKRPKLQPRDQLGGVLWDATKVVSAFTLAHTVSLCMTSLQLLTPPPSRLVESLVAFTILLTAINNLMQFVGEKRWIGGFGFGLVHGIGYASVLSDLGLSGWDLAVPLIGFNVGVEIAQVIIIGVFLPIAFLVRRTSFYRVVFLWGGSIVTAGLAIIWMIEQMFRLSILSWA